MRNRFLVSVSLSRNEKIYVAIVYGFRSNCLRYQDSNFLRVEERSKDKYVPHLIPHLKELYKAGKSLIAVRLVMVETLRVSYSDVILKALCERKRCLNQV